MSKNSQPVASKHHKHKAATAELKIDTQSLEDDSLIEN